MEFDRRVGNVVYLSSLCGKGADVGADLVVHRCNHGCQVEHVWANLYRCVSTGSSHVCDKNCNQRILYDNHSSICRVSGQVFPLSAAEKEATVSVRRKREVSDGHERCLKRRCESPRPASPFLESVFQIAVPASGPFAFGQCSMDLS